MADLAHLPLWDDVARDITRRIRDLDLLPYELARAIAEDAAHSVFADVERWTEIADRKAPMSSTGAADE